MLSFFKWLLVLLCLAALAYFAFFVPLGERTLYRHLVGISETEEAQELKDELSKKAQDVKDDVAEKIPSIGAKDDARGSGDAAGAPLSAPSEKDRRALDDLLKRAADAPGEE
jgi:hypothetical protein